MISVNEFEKKQLVFIFANAGEKLSFSNDNIVVKDNEGKIKHQSTCYRIFALFIIGNFTITSGVISRAKKFCFPILLMNNSLKTIGSFGFRAEGNTLLRSVQYSYCGLDIAKRITENKISNQRVLLGHQRNKNESLKEAIGLLKAYEDKLHKATSINEIMGLEGIAARVYFAQHFNNCSWTGRKPRAKLDFVNTTLDIGYNLLFNYVESLLQLYGFDVYVGVLHKRFYMRKSLVCDLVEPFRPLIDSTIRKAISLNQCKRDDFEYRNGAYILLNEKNKDYILFLLEPLLDNKREIFLYIQNYYRAFIREYPVEDFPIYEMR